MLHRLYLILCTLPHPQVVGTYDYAGCMTVPRLLHLDGDRLHQSPAPELLCLRQGESWHCQDVILEPKAALAVPPGVVGSNFVDIEVGWQYWLPVGERCCCCS